MSGMSIVAAVMDGVGPVSELIVEWSGSRRCCQLRCRHPPHDGVACMHCQQPSTIREAGLRKAIHRFSRNRSMFSLSLHEASLQRLSRPVTLHGTVPCRDQVAFPFSTRAMQGTRSTDSGREATRGRVYPLPIKNIVVGLPHPAVPGDRRTSDANRSYARSLNPTGGHARPTDRTS